MIVGIDYASIDGNVPPDFAKLKDAAKAQGSSVGVAIVRGAYGTWPDPTVQRDWRRAIDAGFTCGAYLLLRMLKGMGPESQVHAFADNVGALRYHDLVPIIDVEDTGFSPEAELEWVHRAWLEMRRTYATPPMIYTSARVWAEDLKDLPAGEMTDSPLWLAKPWPRPIRTPADFTPFKQGVNDPTVPPSWGPGNWWMHQYQGDALPVPGFSNTVDLSRFNLMQQGEMSVRVKWVQQRLGMKVTGMFNSDMTTRIKAFQAMTGLVADGIIGPKTFAPMCWHNGTERPIAA